jgi:hypothetical protein
MEVWMSAHWQFSRGLVHSERLAANKVSARRQGAGVLSQDQEEPWELPDFLPGITIQGHG